MPKVDIFARTSKA